MPISLPQADGLDPETPLSVLSRFAITTLAEDMDEHTVVAQMPACGMRNPFTGLPTVAGLAILVDDGAGRHRWKVDDDATRVDRVERGDELLREQDEYESFVGFLEGLQQPHGSGVAHEVHVMDDDDPHGRLGGRQHRLLHDRLRFLLVDGGTLAKHFGDVGKCSAHDEVGFAR